MNLDEFKKYLEEILTLTKGEVYQQATEDEVHPRGTYFFRTLVASALERAENSANWLKHKLEKDPQHFAKELKRGDELSFHIKMCAQQLENAAKELKQDNAIINTELGREKNEEYKEKVIRIAESFAANVASLKKELSSNGPDTIGDFDKYVKELKDAKTVFNSDEYNGLIEAVKYINTKEKFEIAPDLDEQHTYAAKLWTVKMQIDKYLAHKAQDGVNQNSFKKLAAVEKLNKEITRRLQKLDIPEFSFNTYKVNVKKLAQTDQKDIQTYLKNHDEKTMPSAISDDELTKKYEAAVKRNFKVTKEDMKNVDACMCKITIKACNLGVKEKKVNELRSMRLQFEEAPANEAEPKKEAPKKVAEPVKLV